MCRYLPSPPSTPLGAHTLYPARPQLLDSIPTTALLLFARLQVVLYRLWLAELSAVVHAQCLPDTKSYTGPRSPCVCRDSNLSSHTMMSTQSYYDAGDHESFHLTPRRSMSTSGYYDRLDPYTAYYEPRPRQDPPAGYGGHVPIRAVIHEPDPDGGHGGSSRRRIAVAVSRSQLDLVYATH